MLICVTERSDEAYEGVDITLLADITDKVSMFIISVNALLSNCVARDMRFTSSAHGELKTNTGHYIIGDNFVKCEPIFTTSAPFEDSMPNSGKDLADRIGYKCSVKQGIS